MSQNQRLILAMGISILIMFVWQEYYVTPNMHKTVVNTVAAAAPKISAAERVQDRGLLLSESKKDRVTFANDQVSGSINLRGARIDDLLLKRYHQTINSGSDEVVLLSPSATSAPHFITIGWVSKDKDLVLPDAHTLWRVNHASIKPHAPITLTWKNPQDVLFSIFEINSLKGCYTHIGYISPCVIQSSNFQQILNCTMVLNANNLF